MNILVIGTGENEKALIELCFQSKKLTKIYTASNSEPFENIPNLEFFDIESLAKRVKALQIDAVLTCDKTLIQNGLFDTAQKYRLNPICMNKKWANLEKSRLIAKQLIRHYNINSPAIISYPSTFPVVLKFDNPNNSERFVARSMKELLGKKEELSYKTENKIFLEEFMEGDEYTMVSLWDKESMYYFPILDDKNSTIAELNEVQKDRLDLLKTKMNFMFSDEKADFIGFVTTKLLWAKNDWYVAEFESCLSEKEIRTILMNQKRDFLYILNAAIYQKLNEGIL